MSALEDFAAAATALGGLASCLAHGDTAGTERARAELLARHPEVAPDLLSLEMSGPAARRASITAVGTRLAAAMAPDIARHGQARYREGRYRDAVGAFQLALVLAPDGAIANTLCASALDLANTRAGYVRQARRAVVLAPLEPNARMLAMRGALAARNHGMAEAQARRFVQIEPGGGIGWVVLARALFRGGRPAAALKPLHHARVLAPNDLETQRALARCLFRLGRFDEALTEIEAAATLADTPAESASRSARDHAPDLAFQHARIARSAGRLALAEQLLDALVTRAPDFVFKRRVLELTATRDDLLAPKAQNASTGNEPKQSHRLRESVDLGEAKPLSGKTHPSSSRKWRPRENDDKSASDIGNKVPAFAWTTGKISGTPLYMLVEETNRELASRVLIATAAAARGITSYIIPQWFAWEHQTALPPGVMLFKGHNRAQAHPMRRAREAGHRVAAIEEEILGVTRPEQILRVFDPRGVEACEMFLLQGSHARDVLLDRHPDIESRIRVTGNPRTDALLAPLDGPIRRGAEAIRASHGDFILINTNFGSTNPRLEDTVSDFETCARVGLIDPDNDADRKDYRGWCGWERLNMALLVEVIAAARSRPDFPRIIIRPHPSENIDRWREAYPGDERLRIIREGEHTAWTAAARLLLHTGCTTGVEASLLGTPALSLQGGDSDWHQAHTSNFVNPTAGSTLQALDWIKAVLAGDGSAGAPTPDMHAELERQLLPEGENLAAERIVTALEELQGPASVAPADMERAETLLARRSLLASPEKIDTDAFSASVIQEQVARLSSALGYRTPPRVGAIGDAMIRISPA